MSDHRGPRDHLAIILGLAGVHLNRYGPDARAVFEEIRAEAHAAIAEMGAEDAPAPPYRCEDCDGSGIATGRTDERSWPCYCDEAAAYAWDKEREAAGDFDAIAPIAEVRSWLAARKAPGADGVRDDAPSKSRSVA